MLLFVNSFRIDIILTIRTNNHKRYNTQRSDNSIHIVVCPITYFNNEETTYSRWSDFVHQFYDNFQELTFNFVQFVYFWSSAIGFFFLSSFSNYKIIRHDVRWWCGQMPVFSLILYGFFIRSHYASIKVSSNLCIEPGLSVMENIVMDLHSDKAFSYTFLTSLSLLSQKFVA